MMHHITAVISFFIVQEKKEKKIKLKKIDKNKTKSR